MQVLYRLSYVGSFELVLSLAYLVPCLLRHFARVTKLERETGFEPATLSLEG